MGSDAAILVHTTSHAIHAERTLQQAGIRVKMIPTPRHLSSDCGFALQIAEADREACREHLAAAGVQFDRIEVLPE